MIVIAPPPGARAAGRGPVDHQEGRTCTVALSILDVVRRSACPHDAILGWIDRRDRYANVKL
jgi:hypothetical protein